MNQYIKTGIYRDVLAYKMIPPCKSLLDIGCGNGRFILNFDKAEKRYACDLNEEFIEKLKNKKISIKFVKMTDPTTLPFADSSMHVVTALEVLEHVFEKNKFLREIHRVLKKNGTLIISVPHKGPTSFIDWGNIKYFFPKFHKFLIILIKGKMYFQKKYTSGLFGDMDPRLKIHQHFTVNEIKKLLNGMFRIEMVTRYGFFVPLLLPLRDLYQLLFRKKSTFFAKLILCDAKLFKGLFGYGMIIKATKIK